MRNKILSLALAGFMGAGFLFAYHVLINKTGGHAVASVGGQNGLTSERSTKGRKYIQQKISLDPDYFLSLNAQQVRGVLKDADLVRREQPTVVWQYRSEDCVLDLYFTTNKKDEAFEKVKHYEMRARQKDVSDAAVQKGCVKNLIQARNGFQMVSVAAFYKSLTD